MTIDIDEAIRLATEHVVEEYRRSIVIRKSPNPQEALYGYDPDGWTLFVVTDYGWVGKDKFVAVNMETGETKSFVGASE
jgi:hypothetical protein